MRDLPGNQRPQAGLVSGPSAARHHGSQRRQADVTYNPASLRALGAFWTAQGGVNLGVVGDTAHAAKGYSYHLGADQLAPTAYSIKTARDKAGLTNAASAIDLGRLGGTLSGLRKFSAWLVAEAQKDEPGTADIREIIYTVDGKTVLRWDRERGYASPPRAGEADDSHLTHTHVSFYRDAEARDKRPVFAPYFAPMLEGVMAPITSETAALIDTPAGAPLYDLDGTTKLTTLSDAFASRTSPYGVGPKRAIFVTIGGVRRVVLVTPSAMRPVIGGDCTAAARQGWNDARQAAANAAGAAILAAVPAK